MVEFARIGTEQMVLLSVGAALFVIVPLVIAIVWSVKKKERFTTVLIGALTFLVFALVLEKPLQNLLIFPTYLGLAEHAASTFINARPVLLAVLLGLFPGLFEETGRLVAFKTLLRRRKNRETSISYGLGHGGFEVIFILGITYVTYIAYAVLINKGLFQAVINEAAAKAPEQAGQLYVTAAQLANFSAPELLISVAERIFALLFHIGASILVFYACKDRRRSWLYPLAIILHTAMDALAGLIMAGIISLTVSELEAIIGLFAILVFFGAYFLVYRRDRASHGI